MFGRRGCRARKIVKASVLKRTIEAAARTSGEVPRIRVLLNADDDCPGEVGPALLRRAQAVRRDREVRGVLAKSEFEASLLASVGSLAGQHGVAGNVNRPADPEAIRDAKGWLSHVMPHEPQSGVSLDPPCRHSRSPEITEIWPNKGLTAHVGAVSSFDVDSRHRCRHFCNGLRRDVVSRRDQTTVRGTREDRDPKTSNDCIELMANRRVQAPDHIRAAVLPARCKRIDRETLRRKHEIKSPYA